MTALPRIAYVIDPRFPGGTSSAVAQELRVTSGFGRIVVHAISSRMFEGRAVAPQLSDALDDLGLPLIWDAPEIAADVVILHNPSFLKFQSGLAARIIARRLVVVTHENFLRPGGFETFDTRRCLSLIDRATLALHKSVAPISAYNRATVSEWAGRFGLPGGWSIQPGDWPNICDFAFSAPNPQPADRRGRHSRPGIEKFPPLADLDLCFPRAAVANVILGGDRLQQAARARPHWRMIPFQGITVAEYLGLIDFMVYFTAPAYRESFGRVVAEAIAAGKAVITDAATAENYGGAVIATTPAGVNAEIARLLADPSAYSDHVLAAQQALGGFSSDAFARHVRQVFSSVYECAA